MSAPGVTFKESVLASRPECPCGSGFDGGPRKGSP
jgi:hypothetical protein